MATMGMTNKQLEQFEIQVQVYKAFVHGAPIPTLFLAKLQRYENERIVGLGRLSTPGLPPSFSSGPIPAIAARDFSAFTDPGFAHGFGNPFCPQRRSKSASLLAADPNPSRCRRTDGKRWRCTRSVTADGGHYCQRHSCRKKAEGDSAPQPAEPNPDEPELKQHSRSTKEESHQSGSFGQADSPSNREGEVSSPKKPENFENIFPFDSAGEPATVPAISIGAQATQLEDSSRHRAGDAVRGTKGSAAVNKDASGETGRVCQDDAQSVDSKPCAAGAWSDSVSRQASKPIDVPAKQSPGSARAHGMTKSVAASAVRRVSVGTSQQLSLAVTADKPPPQLTPLLPLLTGSQASPARVLSSGFLPENPPLSGRSISVVPPTCIDGGSAGAHAGYDPYMDLVKEMMVDKQGAEHGTSSGSGLAPSAPFAGPMGAYSSSTLPLLGDIFSDVKGAGGHCRPVRHMKPVAYPKVASWDPSIPRSPVISVSRALGDLRRRSNPESMTTGASMGAMAAASASASACELGAGAAMSGTGAVGSSATVGIHASYGAMGMASSGRTLFAGSAPSAHNLGGSLSGCPSLPAMSCPSLGIAHSELSRGASFSDSATVMPVPSAHEWNATKGGGHYRAKGHGASIHGARSVMSSPPCDDGYLGRGAGAATSAPSTPSLLDLKRKFSRAVGYDLWSMQQQPQQPPLPTPQQQPQVHPAGRRRSYDSDEYGEVDSRSAVSRSSMSYMETIIQEGLSEGLSCPGMPGKRVCPSEGDPSCSMDVSSGIAGAHASWDARMQGHLMGACDPLAGDSADPLADFELAFDSPDMDLLREEPHHVPYGGGLDKGLNTLGKASGGLLDMLGRRHRHNEDVTHVVSRFC